MKLAFTRKRTKTIPTLIEKSQQMKPIIEVKEGSDLEKQLEMLQLQKTILHWQKR